MYIAQALVLDTAVLPGTPFEVGDTFNPGVVVTPPVAADVQVSYRLAPNSDASRMVERTVTGKADRFGYFHPPEGGIALDQQGEYRVDVVVSYTDGQGNLWMGSRTWGSVVAPRDTSLVAHGRRGIDAMKDIGPQWFFRSQTGVAIGGNHVPFPFHSGDIAWLQSSDAATPLVSIQDLGGTVAKLLKDRAQNSAGRGQQVPMQGPGNLEERMKVGEVPLFSSRPDWQDPHLDPSKVDVWAYSYRAVERPLVRVREEISEDALPPPYWRFNEQYAGQAGVGMDGDLPGEIKFQYGAAVVRGRALPQPQYAIYGSLFVLVADKDSRGGTRTFPPFQGNAGGPSGGPIITIRGRDVDMFMHLAGVRPGSTLEVGDTFALSGAIGPALPAQVAYTVTLPGGRRVDFSGRANKIGYYYQPQHNFVAQEPGLYIVDLKVTYDGTTSAGPVTKPFPTGDVLGTADGRFFVYVVPRDSAPLTLDRPETSFLPPPANLDVVASVPAGMEAKGAHVTAMMPGFLLQSGELPVSQGRLSYRYDPVSLAKEVPVLDVLRNNRPQAADVVTISLLVWGTGPDGNPVYATRTLVLHGQELFNTAQAPR